MASKSPLELPGLDLLVDALVSAHSVLIITGAGISIESGCPTLDEIEGTADHRFVTASGFHQDRLAAWKYFNQARIRLAQCMPNAAHIALVVLEDLLPSMVLATHNVDGLHKLAGSKQVLELSGNLWELRCDVEARVFRNFDIPLSRLPPRCSCGSDSRPNVALFDEPLMYEAHAKLREYVEDRPGGFALVVGLSGRNQAIQSDVKIMQANGWTLAEVNLGPNLLSRACDISLMVDCVQILPKVAMRLRENLGLLDNFANLDASA